MILDRFHPAVSAWFRDAFPAPTECQTEAWDAIKSGRHTLIAAPTGSGKTLAAFLAAIDDLVREGDVFGLPEETRVLYISPLKALSNDIHKNLEHRWTASTQNCSSSARPTWQSARRSEPATPRRWRGRP